MVAVNYKWYTAMHQTCMSHGEGGADDHDTAADDIAGTLMIFTLSNLGMLICIHIAVIVVAIHLL